MKPSASRSTWLASLALVAASAALAQNPAPGGAPGNPPPRGEPQAQPPQAPAQPPVLAGGPPVPTVALYSLIERVERSSKKSFLVDPRVRAQVYLGGMREEDVTYPVLLSILRLYGYATFTSEGRVNIVPDAIIRSSPVPIVQNDDRSLAADEWITRIITTTRVNAASLVPILRPMMPQSAHLVAQCTEQVGSEARGECHRLVVMDTYANVQRIAAIVKTLDQ
jgi:general secretion pathway protein D